MLLDSDIQRLDMIMEAVLNKREQRGYLPDRDEDKIADIIRRAEEAAEREHQLTVESRQDFASPVRRQEDVKNSENVKETSSIVRWKNREVE
jgi:hypothetical protein